jgi:phospholipid transport system substrate-binding protein
MKKLLIAFLFGMVCPAMADTSSPDTVITSAMHELQLEMDQNRDKFREDPALLRGVVDKIFLPRFDTAFAAQRVLGKYWKDASDAQQKRFIDVFYRYLVNSYANYLLDFRGDEVQISPYTGAADEKYPQIKTSVSLTKGDTASVNYILRNVDGEWKVIDVVVEGISYVRSYREDFAPQIADKGLDGLIKRLEDTTPELTVKGR